MQTTKSIIVLFIVLITAVLPMGCKKESSNNSSTNKVGDDLIINGKGVRKIWGMQSKRAGFGQFVNAHLTQAADGLVHAVFFYGYGIINGSTDVELYRKKINFNTGDTIATGGLFNVFTSATYQEDGNCLLVPYTDLFVYGDNLARLYGEPAWLPTNSFDGSVRKIYSDEKIVSFSKNNNNNEIIASTYANGQYSDGSKLINADAFSFSMEMTTSGIPLIFTAGNPNLEVYNYATNVLLGSTPVNLYQKAYASGKPQDALMKTKRSMDGKKIIGVMYSRSNEIPGITQYSTFIYDIALNTFAIKIDNARLEKTNLNGFAVKYEVDEEGNLYYMDDNNTTEINKVTPSGETVYRTGFIKDSGINNIKCVGNKLFIVVTQVGNNTYSDERGKGTVVVAVAE
jgi:hypothetical protein